MYFFPSSRNYLTIMKKKKRPMKSVTESKVNASKFSGKTLGHIELVLYVSGMKSRYSHKIHLNIAAHRFKHLFSLLKILLFRMYGLFCWILCAMMQSINCSTHTFTQINTNKKKKKTDRVIEQKGKKIHKEFCVFFFFSIDHNENSKRQNVFGSHRSCFSFISNHLRNFARVRAD